jgi:hypothetical protein
MNSFENKFLFSLVLTLPISFLSFLFCLPFVHRFKERINLKPWEFIGLFLPGIIWAFLFARSSQGKSLANLGEAWPLIATTPVLFGLRAYFGRFPAFRYTVTVLSILALCAVAIACFVYTPALPESSIEAPNRAYDHFSWALQGSALLCYVSIWFLGRQSWNA